MPIFNIADIPAFLILLGARIRDRFGKHLMPSFLEREPLALVPFHQHAHGPGRIVLKEEVELTGKKGFGIVDNGSCIEVRATLLIRLLQCWPCVPKAATNLLTERLLFAKGQQASPSEVVAARKTSLQLLQT